jgi:hypothetical protein
VGIGYGVGIVLMLFATVLIAKSYFSRHPESPAEPPPSSGDSPVSLKPAKLKIISANYGVEGKADPDVSPTLQSRIGDALAVWVENDLAGHDPVHGVPKRLKVSYSFEGSQPRMITREEHELLVLPEPPLRVGMDDRTSIEFRDQWAKTKHLQAYELGMEVSELFTPLQLEAFGIARDLRELALSKPRPVFDTRDYGAGEDGLFSAQEPGKLAVYMTAEATGIQQWRQEIRAKYVLSDLQKKATKLYHRFVDEAHLADRHLGCLVDTVDTDEALLDMAATIRKIAFQLEDAKP